jgi:hypothetical protein
MVQNHVDELKNELRAEIDTLRLNVTASLNPNSSLDVLIGWVFARGSGQPDRMPARPGIGADRPAADQRVPAHVPDRGLAAGVLKQDVGTAVGADGVPARPRIGADRSPVR